MCLTDPAMGRGNWATRPACRIGMPAWERADVALISADLKDGPGGRLQRVLRRLHQYKSTLRCVVLLGHDESPP